ncbi:MAG: class C sortase, partial [Acutalibacteraceae bacterium]
GVFLILLSIALVCYPFISNYLVGLNQQSDVVSYEDTIEDTDEQELQQAYDQAVEYNKSLLGSVVVTDPFDPNFVPQIDYEYSGMLTVGGDIMATIEIPEIELSLPIYHGTNSDVLKKGAGHLPQTSLPVGGESTHAVITGHTGMPAAKLFTDLNILKVGDKFYIHVLGKTLAYQIVKIYVIEPDDTKSLRVYEGKDYVTLITCTPYGVNSHRLLVRGERVPYVEDEQKSPDIISRASESTWMKEYKKALLAGAVILCVILVVFFVLRGIIRHRKQKKQDSQNRNIDSG